MKLREDKINYKRNSEVALVLSLIIVILLFITFPQFNNNGKEIPYFNEPVITILDIPNTGQSNHSGFAPPPLPEIPSQFIPIDEPEILEDISVKEDKSDKNSSENSGNSKFSKDASQRIYEASSFPFVPRQLVEVVPEKVDGAEGAIKLKLLIGKEGYVVKHEIVINSTNNSKCITFVVNAVYKSRWQPVFFDGEKVDYWLEKTYVFN